jgi:hypothetical protein
MVNNDYKKNLLESLENLEVESYDAEKDAIVEVEQCVSSNLFNLIGKASFYRAASGIAQDLFPEDQMIQEHVKSSHNLLTDRALQLTRKFDKECKCRK